MKINPDALVVASRLCKTFTRASASPIEVFRDLDLDIFPNDSIAIVGKSGTGKSTLLHLLGTLEAPTDGSVYFLGQDLSGFSEKRLAAFRNRELGFVFQFHYLMLEFTALENVMMPALVGGIRSAEARQRAMDLIEKVGLGHRISHKPGQLSGGEQQRVAIARALIMQPKLLLTDEMTGNLDPVTGTEVFELVQSLHGQFQTAIVPVTHDEQLAAAYQKIYRLHQGRLVLERG